MRRYRNIHKKNKGLIVILVLLVSLIGIYFGVKNYSFFGFDSIFQDIGAHVTKLFIPKKISYQKVTSLQEESLKEENQELKKMLDLKTTMAGYDMIFATITERNLDYWFHTLTIDKGKKEGIEKDMIVINPDGLVGKISKVNRHSSVILLTTSIDKNNKTAVSVHDKDNIYNGIITGYDMESNQLLVTSIRSTSDVKIGNTVVTNGLGNLFPSGITVGTVEKISNDDLGVSKILKVSSNVNFENLRYVAVLKRSEL